MAICEGLGTQSKRQRVKQKNINKYRYYQLVYKYPKIELHIMYLWIVVENSVFFTAIANIRLLVNHVTNVSKMCFKHEITTQMFNFRLNP